MEKRKQWKYLFDIIRYSLSDSDGLCPMAETAPDWAYLYRICKHNKIEAMVGNVIEDIPSEQQPPEEIKQKFFKKLKMNIAREAVQFFSLEEILEVFEENGVDCMPLKGALLKQFYEKPALRTMADLDILYRSEQKEIMDRVLKELGYDCEGEGDHHDVYLRKPYMNIEMHHCLIAEGEKYSDYYDDVWSKICCEKDKEHIYRFSWEDYYVYMIVHLAKHFQRGGSGIRSIIDIWMFLRNMEEKLDWKYLETELAKLHLKTFEEHMRMLADIWFDSAKSDVFYEELTAFVIDSGIYGTRDNYKAKAVLEKSGEHNKIGIGILKIRMEAIFLPYGPMKRQYAYLEKYPILLPVAWIQRILRTIFKKKGTASRVLRDVKVDEAKAMRVKDVFDALEL